MILYQIKSNENQPNLEYRIAGCYFELNQILKARFYFDNAKRKAPISKFTASLFTVFTNQKQLKKLENSEF